jgi:hypothetical protein
MMTDSSTISSSDLQASLQIVEVKPGKRFSVATLRSLLPDVETALFFGKVYALDASQLAALLHTVLNTDLSSALFGEGAMHSNDLQDYLLDGYRECQACGESEDWCECDYPQLVQRDAIIGGQYDGDVVLDPAVPHGEILPAVWEQLEVEVAASIKAVAEKLESAVAMLPGKQGQMVFTSMMKLNAKRPTLGDYRAQINHAPQKPNLLILDVSGSMTSDTIHKIIEDVVALSYQADASMAVVSDTTTFWEAGTYDVDTVLERCEFNGTHYETLAPLLNRDWGTVITVADYDSSASAKQHLRQKATGRIDQVLDISLVGRPTFLAECVGQFASEVKPILIGNSDYVIGSRYQELGW